MTFQSELLTCSYSRYAPNLGVPVRTTVGTPRNFQFASAQAKTITPYGVFGKSLSKFQYQVAYEDRLTQKRNILVRELEQLSAAYDGQPLVLLCFCDVRKPNGWCHRRMFADWMLEQFDLSVPEVTLPDTWHIAPQVEQPSLFD